MGKRKGSKQTQERKVIKKERNDSPPTNSTSSAPPKRSTTPDEELTRALAALKASETRCAQFAAENQSQHEQLQTLETQNEQLRAQLAKQEQHSTAQIKDLTFEVDELKTELAFFRSNRDLSYVLFLVWLCSIPI